MRPMPCREEERFMPESLRPTNGKRIYAADCVSPLRIREAELPLKTCPAFGTHSLPQKELRATASVYHWSRILCRNTMACSASAAAPKPVIAVRCLVFSCRARSFLSSKVRSGGKAPKLLSFEVLAERETLALVR